jgi:hypothetical protein
LYGSNTSSPGFFNGSRIGADLTFLKRDHLWRSERLAAPQARFASCAIRRRSASPSRTGRSESHRRDPYRSAPVEEIRADPRAVEEISADPRPVEKISADPRPVEKISADPRPVLTIRDDPRPGQPRSIPHLARICGRRYHLGQRPHAKRGI